MVSSCIACLNILVYCVALHCIVLYGIVLYFMVLWCNAPFCFLRLYFKVLFGIECYIYCIVLDCIVFCYMALHAISYGLAWYYINLLHGIVWHCKVLYGIGIVLSSISSCILHVIFVVYVVLSVYVVLYCNILYYATLYCIVLSCNVLCCIVLYGKQYHTIPCNTIQSHI